MMVYSALDLGQEFKHVHVFVNILPLFSHVPLFAQLHYQGLSKRGCSPPTVQHVYKWVPVNCQQSLTKMQWDSAVT